MFESALYSTITLFAILGVIFFGVIGTLIPIAFIVAACSGILTVIGGVVLGIGSTAAMFICYLLACLLAHWVDCR